MKNHSNTPLTETQVRGTTRERGLKHYAALMPELCKHLEEINGHVRFKPPTQKETTRIVDLGCGEGNFLHQLAPYIQNKNKPIELIGFDLYPPKNKIKGVTLKEGNLEEMTLPDNVDYIVSASTIPYINNIARIAQEISWSLTQETGIGFIYLPAFYIGPYAKEIIDACNGLIQYKYNEVDKDRDQIGHYWIVKPSRRDNHTILDAFNNYQSANLPLAAQYLIENPSEKGSYPCTPGFLHGYYLDDAASKEGTYRGNNYSLFKKKEHQKDYYRFGRSSWFIPQNKTIFSVVRQQLIKPENLPKNVSKQLKATINLVNIMMLHSFEKLTDAIDFCIKNQKRSLLTQILNNCIYITDKEKKQIYLIYDDHSAMTQNHTIFLPQTICLVFLAIILWKTFGLGNAKPANVEDWPTGEVTPSPSY